MDITNSQSEKNVKTAFALESQARNKYTYFATIARNEGYEKIADLFETMAGNEKEHAKVWYKVLNNGIPSSLANLEGASASEHKEWESMYPGFAQTAREEGFELLAIMFDNIAEIEKNHETMFLEMLEELRTGGATKKARGWVRFICKNCGHVSAVTLDTCPVCGDTDSFEAEEK